MCTWTNFRSPVSLLILNLFYWLPRGHISWCYCFSSCCSAHNIQYFLNLLRANILSPQIKCKSLTSTRDPSLFLLYIIVTICTTLKTYWTVLYFFLICHMYFKNLRKIVYPIYQGICHFCCSSFILEVPSFSQVSFAASMKNLEFQHFF